MFKINFFFFLFLCIAFQVSADQGRHPLLQEGKKTLYQRVVSHPEAKLYSGPSSSDAALPGKIKTFTVFYVYAKEGNRFEVGVDTSNPTGWVDSDKVTEWSQAITMVFTERGSRMPVLFFKNHNELVNTCQDENMDQRLKTYRDAVEKARTEKKDIPSNIPLVATEPPDKEGAISNKRFYLMPVLNIDTQFKSVKLLEVASIDPGDNKKEDQSDAHSADFRTAIAFVIDTTISMRPYIEQSLQVIRDVYNNLEKSKHGDKVAFAVVAYRNSVEASPNLEYCSKVISDFKTVKDRKTLEDALSGVREASVSTHDVNEDAMSGIKTAIDSLHWKNYASRVLLLVTDAGPLKSKDKYASTGMDSAEMADYMRTNNIWSTVLHIKSPSNKNNHEFAQREYLKLTKMPSGDVSYIPIDAQTPAIGAQSFDKASRAMAEMYKTLVEATAEGKMLAKPKAPSQNSDNPEKRAKEVAENIGYSMQLEFLGATRHNPAPSVVKAWISDTDLDRLAQDASRVSIAVEPSVLLTKNQLSDLSAQIKLLIDQATRSQRLGGSDFFQNLVSMAAQLTRDPSRFSYTPGQNLAQTGLLGEFLEGLPYRSRVLGMKENDWYNMQVGDQDAFINELRSLVARYEEYDKDQENWESFGSPNAGDWVYRVPLSMLP